MFGCTIVRLFRTLALKVPEACRISRTDPSISPGCGRRACSRAYDYSASAQGRSARAATPTSSIPLGRRDHRRARLDTASVCAGLLHDVVEDTLATTDDIEREFGSEIAFLVDGVTKLGKINFTSKEDRQAENFRKMVVAMARDIRVLLVKLCDRLDNMRTLEHMKPEAQERIARETMEIYAPLANRLGIQRVQERARGSVVPVPGARGVRGARRQASRRPERERDKYIAERLQDARRRASPSRASPPRSPGRAKHLYSIWRKMKAQQCEFEQIYDIIAFRVCVESVADCYAALGVIHSQWTPVPGRFKDYIALPKPNMYQSLHTTVIGPGRERIEIQIRTHEMHRVAEHGIAAHWKYKERTAAASIRSDAAALRLAAPADGVPEGPQGPGRVPREREGRPLPGRGLRLHAQGRRARVPARLDARSTSRTRSTRRSASTVPARA